MVGSLFTGILKIQGQEFKVREEQIQVAQMVCYQNQETFSNKGALAEGDSLAPSSPCGWHCVYTQPSLKSAPL